MLATPPSLIAGLRVLVVEDDFFIARSLTSELMRMHCEVLGPVGQAHEAVALVREEDFDLAILDINLAPGTSEPIARALQDRGTPFLFITGYGNPGVLPSDLRGHRVLHKPIDSAMLQAAIERTLDDYRGA